MVEFYPAPAALPEERMNDLAQLYSRADPLEQRLDAIIDRLERLLALLAPTPPDSDPRGQAAPRATAVRCRRCGQFGHDREHP